MKACLKNNYTGEETPFKTVLDYGRYDGGLYFNFDCENSQLFSAYDKDNEPIYRGDVAEIFICVCGDRRKYFEIEVAPNGTVFLRISATRTDSTRSCLTRNRFKRRLRPATAVT